MAAAADQGVVAQIAPQPVVAAAALEFIVAPVALEHVVAYAAQQAIPESRSVEGVVPRQSIDPVDEVLVAAEPVVAGGGAAHHHLGAQTRIVPESPITEAEALDPQRWKGEVSLHAQLISRDEAQPQVIAQAL